MAEFLLFKKKKINKENMYYFLATKSAAYSIKYYHDSCMFYAPGEAATRTGLARFPSGHKH